eukprot:scaffold15022_cov117-Isochrysis_galbana.AAC.2
MGNIASSAGEMLSFTRRPTSEGAWRYRRGEGGCPGSGTRAAHAGLYPCALSTPTVARSRAGNGPPSPHGPPASTSPRVHCNDQPYGTIYSTPGISPYRTVSSAGARPRIVDRRRAVAR